MRRIAQIRLTGAVVLAALCAASARGQTVEELVRIRGQAKTTLSGLGIVVGLAGTGDKSKDSYVAARPFRELLASLDNPVATLDELQAANAYAIVHVSAEVPERGGSQGDQVDVTVSKLFNASSLAGGTLITSLLYLPVRGATSPLAAASGGVIVEGSDPTSGVVRGGAQLLQDIGLENLVNETGHLWLAIEQPYVGFDTAQLIANAINEEMSGVGSFAAIGGDAVAVAESHRMIRVLLPEADRADPVPFIAGVMRVGIHHSLIKTPARVLINRKANHIIADAHVMVRPVAITHGSLRLRPIADPAVQAVDPQSVPDKRWVGFDTTDGTSNGTTRLRDLLDALEALNVPTEDQIDIIFDLEKQGALLGEIVS